MVYQMGTGAIYDTLVAKARAGLRVRVILDVSQQGYNQRFMDGLNEAGANAIWSDPSFTYMHAKVLIVDRAEAIVSTSNYGERYLLEGRNLAVRDTDRADVTVLSRLFYADFTRTAPDLSCTRLLIAPVNAKQRLLDLIASAKREIVIESMQLADDDIHDALAARRAAGVEVRALLADPSWVGSNRRAATALAASNIPARFLKSPAIHVKAIVVDGEVAYVGSENLSRTSLMKNREVGMLATEPANAASVKATFEKDWARATPF
jgi:cardiolipin synthase A/B